MKIQIVSESEENTILVAEKFAKSLFAPCVVALEGDLGAGKTTFAKGVARGLGIAEAITSPTFTIMNEYQGAKNKLYHFAEDGSIIKEYDVATGKKTTPTDKGIRMVTWVENYPYRSAPAISKRRKAPWDYGPKIIVIGVVDEKTGEVTHFNGEFIHGTNKPQSIGTNASKGCVRMRNEDVKELAAQMEKGMYVVIK